MVPGMRLRAALLAAFAMAATGRAAAAQGTLEGSVTDAAGRPLSGVRVTLARPTVSDPAPDEILDNGATRAPTGSKASRRCSHEVRFTRLGYGARTLVASFADGDTTRLDVTLSDAVIAMERLVVIGSRAQPRTATQSMVPLDVVPVSELTGQGTPDLSSQLRSVLPSYNVADEPISDAATIARPVSIRNLAPEQTLVMIDGKRRHRSAVIVLWNGNGVADGAQGPDISTLPSIAMSRVEVLRDGASAQYGSDAIAGVINIVPKSNRSGGSFEVRGGRYREGDGDMVAAAGNIGLPLGRDRIPQPERRIRPVGSHEPQHSAKRRGGARGRRLSRAGPRADLGVPRRGRQRQAVREHGLTRSAAARNSTGSATTT